MAGSDFRQDLSVEQRLQPVLDDVYIAKGLNFERVTDAERKKQGIDVIMRKEGKQFLVDEKAQAYYICVSLPTFAFEVCYKLLGTLRTGWLFDEDKNTDTYALVTDIRTDDCSVEGIVEHLRVFMMPRERLLKQLIEEGMRYSDLLKLREAMIVNGEKRRTIPGWKGCSLHISDQLAEQPFNLVLNLAFLEEKGLIRELYSGPVSD